MNKLFLSLIFAMFIAGSASPVKVEVYTLGGNKICDVGDLDYGFVHTPQEMAALIVNTAPKRFTPPSPELFVTENQRLDPAETYFARYKENTSSHISSYVVYVIKRFSIKPSKVYYCPIGDRAEAFSCANLADYIDERIQGGAEGEELTIGLHAVVSDPRHYKKQVRIIRRSYGHFLGLSYQGEIIDIFPLALKQQEVTLLASALEIYGTKQENVAFILTWLAENAPRSPAQIAEFERLNAQ